VEKREAATERSVTVNDSAYDAATGGNSGGMSTGGSRVLASETKVRLGVSSSEKG